jgi:hypothetical protein
MRAFVAGLWLMLSAIPAFAQTTQYVVTFPARQSDSVEVEWSWTPAPGPVRICSDRVDG